MSTFDDGTASGVTATTMPGAFGSVAGGGTATVISDGAVSSSMQSADPEVFQRAGASRAAIHKTVPNSYEPTTDWFAGHKYYTPTAINNFTQEQISLKANTSRGPYSITKGTGSLNAAGGTATDLSTAALAQMNGSMTNPTSNAAGAGIEDPTGFFPSAATVAKKNNEELQATCEKYQDRETSNLSALHAMLYPLVTQDGKISVESVKKVVQGIAVPGAHVADFVTVWFMHLGVPVEGYLPYEDVMSGLWELFNGTGAKKTAEQCFKLCDITSAKFILKDQILGLKPKYMAQEEAAAAQQQQQQANNSGENEDEDEDDAGAATRKPEVNTDHLTYLIVKAVLRCFEFIAIAEEEKVRAAQSKGRKKKKNAPLKMPTKRQFHISLAEFKDLLQKDPHLVVAFLPYAMMISTEV